MTETMLTGGLAAGGGAVRILLEEALTCLGRAETGDAERFIRQATHLMTAPAPDSAAGGLATWQKRRVVAFVRDHLADHLRISAAAAVASRSPSCFSRAFRVSFGCSFLQYVIAERIRRAQFLMLVSDWTISEIALDCGLSDQAHLTRLFRRAVGETPSVWRRLRRDADRAENERRLSA